MSEALADQDDDPVDETQPDTIEARISTLINTQSMTADDPSDRTDHGQRQFRPMAGQIDR